MAVFDYKNSHGVSALKDVGECVIDNFIKSLTEHPSLTVFVLLLWAGIFGYSVRTFADKITLVTHIQASNVQFQTLEERFDTLDFTLLTRDLENEIYKLEGVIDTPDARPRDFERLNKLRQSLKEAHRLRNENLKKAQSRR